MQLTRIEDLLRGGSLAVQSREHLFHRHARLMSISLCRVGWGRGGVDCTGAGSTGNVTEARQLPLARAVALSGLSDGDGGGEVAVRSNVVHKLHPVARRRRREDAGGRLGPVTVRDDRPRAGTVDVSAFLGHGCHEGTVHSANLSAQVPDQIPSRPRFGPVGSVG